MITGRHRRESGTVLSQNNGFLTIRLTNNINMEVCLILSIFKGYTNLLISKIVVSFDVVLKVSTESDVVSEDVSPHIILRSLVRVLHGPYMDRQGVVSEKCNLGRELIVIDPDNNKNGSFPISSYFG